MEAGPLRQVRESKALGIIPERSENLAGSNKGFHGFGVSLRATADPILDPNPAERTRQIKTIPETIESDDLTTVSQCTTFHASA
jgi:hypothetical protein